MDESPEQFVARDKARGLAWRLERLLQERRLAWRGESLGMSALVDDAPESLAALASEAEVAAEGIVAGRLRDRERGYMEVPCATALEGVATRLRVAACLLQVPRLLISHRELREIQRPLRNRVPIGVDRVGANLRQALAGSDAVGNP